MTLKTKHGSTHCDFIVPANTQIIHMILTFLLHLLPSSALSFCINFSNFISFKYTIRRFINTFLIFVKERGSNSRRIAQTNCWKRIQVLSLKIKVIYNKILILEHDPKGAKAREENRGDISNGRLLNGDESMRAPEGEAVSPPHLKMATPIIGLDNLSGPVEAGAETKG